MKLIEYHSTFHPLIEEYYLEDATFTGKPIEAVQISKKYPDYHSILCMDNKQLVTFFVLDSGKDKYKYTDCPNSILLRSFSTDSRHTRKGYAKESLNLLPQFIKKNYPDISEVVLGVNEKNPAAIHLYEDCGFHDTFRKYSLQEHEQKYKGDQKILVMELKK